VLDRVFSGDVGEDETCEYATSFSTTLRTHSVPIKRLLDISYLVVRFGSELPMACHLESFSKLKQSAYSVSISCALIGLYTLQWTYVLESAVLPMTFLRSFVPSVIRLCRIRDWLNRFTGRWATLVHSQFHALSC